MAEVIRMPRMSDTMEEGNIVAWLKKVGDTVEPGDILAEVETDKATMELESYYEGTLLYIGVESGPVAVDGVLAVIGAKDEDYKSALAGATSASPAKSEDKETSSPDESAEKEEKTPEPLAETVIETGPSESSTDSRVIASPLAKSIAKEKGLDISQIKGSGEGGRIIKRDVEKSEIPTSQKPIADSVTSSNVQEAPSFGDTPISQMRKTIAKRLAESKFTSPHFYLTIDINMDATVAARKAINEDENIKISFNDFVVKASAAALKKHPNINASWLTDKIRVHDNINIGVAVAVPDGLVVPVLFAADKMSLSTINKEVKQLADKAKNKKLSIPEMQGNTFTISNLGMFGIEEFTAIINPPDACILAVGAIIPKPIVVAGQIVIANIMKVTLSCDHRIVDGASGAQFLNTLKFYLENPVRILAY